MSERGTYGGITVYYDRVLVQRRGAKEEYAPGLAVPQQFQRKTQEGRVLAVDPEGRYFNGLGFVPLRVKVGDYVLFGLHAGTEVELLDGSVAFILREDEIVGTVDAPADATPEESAA